MIKATAFTIMIGITLTAPIATAQAPLSTAWTYQGQLKDAGAPAIGDYDMFFEPYDAPSVGNQAGPRLWARP